MTEATIEQTPDPTQVHVRAESCLRRGVAIETRALTLRSGAQRLLSELSFKARPGELVAVLGASGSGKSTLLNVLAGLREAREGEVLLDGEPAGVEELANAVGFVPQDDVLHLELTPFESLRYASQLRRRAGFPAAERDERVWALLTQLGLQVVSDRPVRRLSGGQRKRVSLGLELLDDPGVLLLDEPTAGLDPSLHRRLLGLFRQLADEGRTVVLSTHRLEDLDRCDRLVVLDAGRLVFSGTPAAARARFGIDDLTLLYDRLPRSPRGERLEGSAQPARRRRLRRPAHSPRRLRQAWTVLRRAALLLVRDRRRSAILLAQAPLLGLVVAAALEGPALLLFLLVLTAIWCGTSTAARELVKERPVFRREQRAGLSLLSYLGAKGALLAGIAALQVALLLGVVASVRPLPGDLFALYGALMASALTASALGLAISSVARTPDQANALVPLALIPQVLLAGALTTPSDLSEQLGRLTPARWGYDLALRLSADEALPIRHEGAHRREAEGLAERERDLSERAARLLEDELAPAGRGHARALRSMRRMHEDAQAIERELAQLDQDLAGVRKEQAELDELSEKARENVDLVKGRKKVRVEHVLGKKRKHSKKREPDWVLEVQLRAKAARELIDQADELQVASRRLQSASAPVEQRFSEIKRLHVKVQAAEQELREASRTDEGEWRRAVERIAGARAEARALWQEAERLDQRRVALSDEVAQGRIARFEALGSVRHDLAALAGFALACAGVAALGLRRS